MNTKQAIKSVSFLWIGSIVGAACAFATQVILARHLVPAEFGKFSAAFATVVMLVPFSLFGIAQFWLKVFGEEGWDGRRWLRPSLSFVALMAIITLGLLFLWAWFGPHDGVVRFLLLALSVCVVGQVSLELVSGIFQLEAEYLILAGWQLSPHVIRVALIGATVFFAADWLTVERVSVLYALVAILLVIVGGLQLLRLKRHGISLEGHGPKATCSDSKRTSWYNVLTGAWPFGVAGVFQLIYFQGPVVFVKYLATDEAAALYIVAFTIVIAVYLLPTVIYQKFLLPKIHRWAKFDRPKFRRVYDQGNILMFVTGMLFVVAIQLLAKNGITYLFGHEYAGSVLLLKVLVLGAPFVFVSFSAGAVLSTGDHMRKKVVFMGLAAVLNLLLNLCLIPVYGALGASLAVVASNMFLMTVYLVAARKYVFALEADVPTSG